jgi:hypothetical protein
MGACGSGSCGITRIREDERQAARALAERIHPGLVWSEQVSPLPAFTFDALSRLAAHLEELLPLRAIVKTNGSLAIDLLAGLHSPSLSELVDAGQVGREETVAEGEVYLRLTFSPWGQFVTIQEVRMRASSSPDDLEIADEPVLGVEDLGLRSIVKGLQGALRKARLTLLDMAFLATPLPLPQTRYEERFCEAPTLWSLLMSAAPPTSRRVSLVRRRPVAAGAESCPAPARSPLLCRTPPTSAPTEGRT